MGLRQAFTITGKLDGCNEYTAACRMHPQKGAALKRENQEIVLWAIRAARLKKMAGKVNVSFKWVEPNMRRDKDNIRFASKFILDALVEVQIIRDDSWTYIGDMTDEFYHSAINPRIEVTLEEI